MNRQSGAPGQSSDGTDKKAIDLALIARIVHRDEAALAASSRLVSTPSPVAFNDVSASKARAPNKKAPSR